MKMAITKMIDTSVGIPSPHLDTASTRPPARPRVSAAAPKAARAQGASGFSGAAESDDAGASVRAIDADEGTS
jgi:hypothetical protein